MGSLHQHTVTAIDSVRILGLPQNMNSNRESVVPSSSQVSEGSPSLHQPSSSTRCWRKVKSSYRQGKIFFALFMSMVGSSYSITMMFPFLPFMVQFLLPNIDESSVGKYAGYIASAMFLGRFVGSYAWGAVSDVFGYKPILVSCNILLALTSLMFGFSVNFPMAIAIRFLVGLVNGAVGNTKAAVSVHCDTKHQALGMSIVSSSYGFGIIVGPAISGAVADPIGQYNLNITDTGVRNMFTLFPYSLPCIVNCFVCLMSALCVFLFLPGQKKIKSRVPVTSESPNEQESSNERETSFNTDNDNHTEDTGNDNGGVEVSDIHNIAEDEVNGEGQESSTVPESRALNGVNPSPSDDIEPGPRPLARRKSSYVLSIVPGRKHSASLQYAKVHRSVLNRMRNGQTELDTVRDDEEGEEDTSQLLPEEGGGGHVRPCTKEWWKKQVKNTKKSLIKSIKNVKLFVCDPVSRKTLTIYCVFSFVMIGFDEVYSLWCATPITSGGLGFTLSQIGTSLSIVGALLLPFSLVFYPFLERKIGTRKSFFLGLFILLFFLTISPNIHYLVTTNKVALWVVLSFVMLLIRCCGSINFAASSVLINNSVTMDKLGSINGLALMLTSAFRFVSPIFAGTIYSVSLSNQDIGFPLNYHLIFIIFGIILMFTLLLAVTLPTSIDRQKVSANPTTSETAV